MDLPKISTAVETPTFESRLASPASSTDSSLSDGPLKYSTVTVRNRMNLPEPFVLLPLPPNFTPGGNTPLVVRTSVYQACRPVAAVTGSHTFVIPHLGGAALMVAGESQSTQGPIYAVTGRAMKLPKPGVTLFRSDYCLLEEGDGASPPSHCVMTMPPDRDPAFVKRNLNDGVNTTAQGKFVGIDVDTSFSISDPGKNKTLESHGYPFVGIGAPDPNNPEDIIPTLTWDATPATQWKMEVNFKDWLITRFSQNRGSIIALTQLGPTQSVTIGQGRNPVELAYESNGTFTELTL